MAGGMKVGGSGGRRSRRKRAQLMTEINVTPFVDVMLVLLIIFMVTAPLLATGVPLDLPQAKSKQLETQNKELLVVSVTKDGQIFIGQEEKIATSLDELTQKLTKIAEARGGTDEPIFVRGAIQAEYGIVHKVLAKISEAGFRKISLVNEGQSGG